MDTTPTAAGHSVTARDLTPFRAFTGPMCTTPTLAPHVPTLARSSRRNASTFHETIILVSLCAQNINKASSSSSGVDYKTVTHVVVTLEADNCSPTTVSENIEQQVGLQVILLDSKCFPIVNTESTCSVEFWKGNRKILAASKSIYVKMTGLPTNPQRAREESEEV